MQLFKVCQGDIDTDMTWNEHFDRSISILGTHRSMRYLSAHVRIICNELVLMLVLIDDCIISTKSEKVRLKVVDNPKQYFPLTTKERKN